MSSKDGPVYNSSILEEQARRLLSAARSIVLRYALLGFLLASAISLVSAAGFISSRLYDVGQGIAVLTTFVVVEFVAIAIGRERGFKLRLQAHTLLCQVQQERNMRAVVELLAEQRSLRKLADHQRLEQLRSALSPSRRRCSRTRFLLLCPLSITQEPYRTHLRTAFSESPYSCDLDRRITSE